MQRWEEEKALLAVAAFKHFDSIPEEWGPYIMTSIKLHTKFRKKLPMNLDCLHQLRMVEEVYQMVFSSDKKMFLSASDGYL